MLSHDYSYAAVLQGSVTHAWTIDDCFQGRDFNFSKPFLPDRIAGLHDITDITCLERSIGRILTADEKEEIRTVQQRAYRWTFLVSGLEHPKFAEIINGITVERRDKIASAALAFSE
jgi:hypothetical protein